MSADSGPADATRFQVTARVDTHLSWLRTRLSIERTLMSWVRTATALIGFGFTIFQFLEHFTGTPGVRPARHPHAPQLLGLTFIAAGVIALVIAAAEYRAGIRYLWGKQFEPVAGVGEKPVTTPIIGVTVLLIVVGIFAFVAVLLRFE